MRQFAFLKHLMYWLILSPLVANGSLLSQVTNQFKTVPNKIDIQRLKIPDLTVSFPMKVRFDRHSSLKNISRSIRVNVKNTGNGTAVNFFVDFILSTDQSAAVTYATYAPDFHEDVLLKGGRMHIKSLAPGSVVSLTIPQLVSIPKRMPRKGLYIGAVVDSGNSVKESNEKNNIAFLKYKVPLFFQAKIDNIVEVGVMPSSTGNIELHLYGSGFGSVMGSKIVKMGGYTLEVEGYGGWYAWDDNSIVSIVPYNIPFGVYYDVFLIDNGNIISNKKKILLKIDLEGCYVQVGNSYEDQGQPGSTLELHGCGFGSSQGNQHIRFGSLTVPAVTWTNTRVTFICPTLPPSSYQVWIEKNGLDISLQKRSFQVLPQ